MNFIKKLKLLSFLSNTKATVKWENGRCFLSWWDDVADYSTLGDDSLLKAYDSIQAGRVSVIYF